MHQPCANGAVDAQHHVNGDTVERNGDLEPPGRTMSQTDQEIVRLIGQHLLSIGLERSAALLMEESGLHLEHPAAATFRQHVLAGDWLKADHDLRALHDLLQDSPHLDPQSLTEMKFVVLEQKYLEHLEGGRVLDALHVLRNELTPLQHDTPRVHRLSALMMCADAAELQARARWPGAGPLSRSAVLARVQAVLPPALMMAPGRLRALLAQAAAQQAARCRFHAAPRPAPHASHIPFTLLADHHCAPDHFPIHQLQVLRASARRRCRAHHRVQRSVCPGAERALRRGVVLQVVARRLQAGLGLQGQHRHDMGLRPRRQAPHLQEVVRRALIRRVVPGVEPRRPLPALRRPRGLPRHLDMEHGDGAAAREDVALDGGLADGGRVARLLRQVRVRRRARPVLPLLGGRRAAQQLGRRARQRAGVPRRRARRARRRHAPPRAPVRLHRPRRPQRDPGGARRDGHDAERRRHAAAAQRRQPGRAPLGHTRARARAALPRPQPGTLHHPRVLRRRAAGLHRLGQRGQQGVHLAHQRRGAHRGGVGAHALRQRGLLEPRAPRRHRVRLRRLQPAPVGPARAPLLAGAPRAPRTPPRAAPGAPRAAPRPRAAARAPRAAPRATPRASAAAHARRAANVTARLHCRSC